MIEEFEMMRITLSLPANLYRRMQHLVDQGLFPKHDAVIVAALERFLSELERDAIDHQFAALADDDSFQRLNEKLSGTFAESDWEAFLEGESNKAG